MSGWTKGNKWGGKREGSGRKPSGLGETVVMRVPVSRVEEIKQLISGEISGDGQAEALTEKIKSLTEKWEVLITPERSKQPRWENAARLLQELKNIVQESP